MPQIETLVCAAALVEKGMIDVSLSEDVRCMKRFEYREPRFPVDLVVQFSTGRDIHAGRCTEISATGLRLDLSTSVAAGGRGFVQLRYQGQTLALNARVAHTDSRGSGLEFLYHSSEEKTDLRQLLVVMSTPGRRHGVSLVPKCNDSGIGPSQCA